MKFQAPQIIYLVIVAINLLIAANRHGKQNPRKDNFWISLTASALGLGLLYWGGFFSL